MVDIQAGCIPRGAMPKGRFVDALRPDNCSVLLSAGRLAYQCTRVQVMELASGTRHPAFDGGCFHLDRLCAAVHACWSGLHMKDHCTTLSAIVGLDRLGIPGR